MEVWENISRHSHRVLGSGFACYFFEFLLYLCIHLIFQGMSGYIGLRKSGE